MCDVELGSSSSVCTTCTVAGGCGDRARSSSASIRDSRPGRSTPTAGSSSNRRGWRPKSERASRILWRSPWEHRPNSWSMIRSQRSWCKSSTACASSASLKVDHHVARVPSRPVRTTSRAVASRGRRSATRCPTDPMRLRSSRRSVLPMSSPSTWTCPVVGCRSAPASDNRVVFPAPFGPINAQCSCAAICTVIGPSVARPLTTTVTSSMSTTSSAGACALIGRSRLRTFRLACARSGGVARLRNMA